jgi:hypothetical protein
LGFHDNRSDYLLWRSGSSTGARRDLAAHDLARTILEARAALIPPSILSAPQYSELRRAG